MSQSDQKLGSLMCGNPDLDAFSILALPLAAECDRVLLAAFTGPCV
jgi:hypothetical protein